MGEKEQALRIAGHTLLDRLDPGQLQLAMQFITRLVDGHAEDWGPLGTVLGIQDGGRGEGVSSYALPVADIHHNPMGFAHGCVSFALVDFGMGYALKTMLRPEQWGASEEVNIRHLRPVRRTRLVCRSQVVDVSGDLAHVESQVLNSSGQAVAEARGTYRLFESGRRFFKPRLGPQDQMEEERP